MSPNQPEVRKTQVRKTEKPDNWLIGQALFGLATTAVRSVPRDMGLTSLSTMATLERCGPRRITDLAASEGVTQPSMTALVSGLERAGLVERRTDASDKRVALVALTGEGWNYIETRRQAGTEALVRLITVLPAGERRTLRAACAALIHLHDLEETQRDRATQGPDRRLEGALP
jgi:DNA-binding MarR family transcriptional regulator